MTNEERIELVKDAWETYGEIANSGLTTHELSEIDDLLNVVIELVRER